jgi:hypothetical protein
MRGQGFSPNETSALLDLMASHLPISASDWDNIARSHLVYYPESRRQVIHCRESLIPCVQ